MSFYVWLIKLVVCVLIICYISTYSYGFKAGKVILKRSKQNVTLVILWSCKFFLRVKYGAFQFCLPCKTWQIAKPPSVSAGLSSLILVLCFLSLHPYDTGAAKGDKWLNSPTPSPNHFFHILLCGGYTISFDRHRLWVEFPLSSAGMVWIQSQPSVKRQTRQKIEHLHHYLQQPIYIKVDEIFM